MSLAFTILAEMGDSKNQPVELFGTKLIGITPENGRKLLITIGFIIFVVAVHYLLKGVAKLVLRIRRTEKVVFWTRQAISLLLAVIVFIGVLSIWFNDPQRLGTFVGLVTAGVAFALQKPISALAGYLVILRGNTFSVGDRITMGGVRGDVIALRFTQTTIMEMGQPADVQDADPAMWVEARQYTGRLVTVSNSTVFDQPVYNYTREFPFLWEEMRLPVSYKDDRRKAEQILLETAHRHTVQIREISQEQMQELRRRYFLANDDLHPRVFWRLTDNWLEMTVRFITRTHGIRGLKDAMSRDIIKALDEAGIGIASGTYEIVGMPPLEVQVASNGRTPDGEREPLRQLQRPS